MNSGASLPSCMCPGASEIAAEEQGRSGRHLPCAEALGDHLGARPGGTHPICRVQVRFMGRGPCPESGDPFGHLFPKGRSHGRLDTPFQLKGWGLLTSKRPHKRLKSLCAVATPTGLCAQSVIQGCTEPPRAGPRTAGGLPQTLHFRGGVQHLDGFVNHDRSAETPPQGTWAQDKTEENVEGPPPQVTRTGSQEKAGAQRKADAAGPPGVGDTHGGVCGVEPQ